MRPDSLALTPGIHHDVGTMMHRTQIMLDPEEHRRARQRAADAGISLAEYVRRLVRADLDETPRADVSVLFGLGDSGGSDIATHKDDYIGEAIESEYERGLVKR